MIFVIYFRVVELLDKDFELFLFVGIESIEASLHDVSGVVMLEWAAGDEDQLFDEGGIVGGDQETEPSAPGKANKSDRRLRTGFQRIP